jgi:Family of unknown function (DUF5677)/Crp-like helix-turn-helix domain
VTNDRLNRQQGVEEIPGEESRSDEIREEERRAGEMTDTENDDNKKPDAAANDPVRLPTEGLIMVFGNQQAQDEFNRDHAAFIEHVPYLRDTINAALELSHDRDLTWHDVAVLSLARMAFEDFRQILLLCSNGETTGGMKILRGMFERVVTARYLDRHPKEADAFINYFPISRYKEANAAREFLSEEKLKEIKAERDEVIGLYEIRERCKDCNREEKRINHNWTRVDTPRMAELAGIKLPTVTGYYLPMQETHATLASIMRRLRPESEIYVPLLDHTHTLSEQIAQAAVCNQFHKTDQRLARWLLLARDMTRYGAFNLTHEAMAQIFGVSRSGVSLAAGLLQMRGLIRYARGRITLLNPKGLEGSSCECYRILSRTIRSLLPPDNLSAKDGVTP